MIGDYPQTRIRPGRKATDIPKRLLNPEAHMKQTKLPKGNKKNCVIYTNLKQNKQVCTSYVCDECGFIGLLRHFITLKSVLKKHTKRKKILNFF